MSSGRLYVVATPIGNLNDITLRALDVLKQVDFIAAEDTRHSAKLLSHFAISTSCFAVHDHNEPEQIAKVQGILLQGQSIALISDAGTPLISDPGYKLVTAIRQQGFEVLTIPGPCAAIAALSVGGLPTDSFLFKGFLPAKQQARRTVLEALQNESATLVFYESPKRVQSTMVDVAEVLGVERQVVLARELTKTFETVVSMPAGEIGAWLSADENHRRGEFVILIEGAPQLEVDEIAIDAAVIRALTLAHEYMPLKKACELLSEVTGLPKNALYRQALTEIKT